MTEDFGTSVIWLISEEVNCLLWRFQITRIISVECSRLAVTGAGAIVKIGEEMMKILNAKDEMVVAAHVWSQKWLVIYWW